MYAKQFFIKHVFKKCSLLVNEQSGIEVHFGVPWLLHVKKLDGKMAVYLHCCKTADETNQWSIDTNFHFIMASNQTTKRDIAYKFVKPEGYGSVNFGEWENVMNNHVVDDCLTIECHVTIKKMTGCAPKRKIDFDKPKENWTDGVLKVGEKIFNVNKAILGFRSPYFNTLFFGPFEDSKKSEIELQEVDPIDFQNMLDIVYGESLMIQDENVESMLRLADQFDVRMVREKCSDYLISADGIDQRTKFRLADKYGLQELMDQILESITSIKKLKKFSPADPSTLKPSSLLALYQKCLSLPYY